MKKFKMFGMILTVFCFVLLGMLAAPHKGDVAYAKKITKDSQVVKLAKKKVPGAQIFEIDRDYEKGNLLYEVKMIKGTKEYDLTYLASNGSLVQYEWEQNRINRTSKKKIMSMSKCKSLAKKKVRGATITSIRLKYDDGVQQYKVKMKKGTTKYELDYHAKTRELLSYGWEKRITSKAGNNNYIGVEEAKKIALSKVPGATVIKVEFDRDDGVPVYEVELVKDEYEYDIEIHAVTGKVLDFDQDFREDIYY